MLTNLILIHIHGLDVPEEASWHTQGHIADAWWTWNMSTAWSLWQCHTVSPLYLTFHYFLRLSASSRWEGTWEALLLRLAQAHP